MGKLSDLGNDASSYRETLENGEDIGALLHRYDPELVFLVDPNEELFSFIVEDSSALGPVSV